jgi:opacity protein-like surface antigen
LKRTSLRGHRLFFVAVMLIGLGSGGSAHAEGGPDADDAYDRTGFHMGLGGFYAFADFGYDANNLGVLAAYGGFNFDPGFEWSAGVDVLLGYRVHSHFDVGFQYEWLKGFDSTRGDPPLEIDTHLLLLDARVFPLTGRWQPYGLVGAGVLITNTEIVNSAFKKPWDLDVGPVFRFGGGLDFYVTPHWTIGLDGAYMLAVADVKNADYGTIGMNFRYRF